MNVPDCTRVRALALEKKVAVFCRSSGKISDLRWNENFKTKCSFRGIVPEITFFEILAIPILKIYRGFPYQNFDFLDIWEFLTNFENSDFENL